MSYITSVERIGMEKGRREGVLESVELQLESKFGKVGVDLMPVLRQITDIDRLRTVVRFLSSATSVDEVRDFISQPSA